MSRWAPPDVISAAASGDKPALERLIAAIWPACFRLAASLIGDTSLAQDAAQDACAIVYRKMASVRHVDAFDAWLYRVVVRESSRVRKRHQRDNTPAYEQGFTADATIGLDVWRALAQLSPALRDVTVLFYFDDLTSEEIARVLGIPHATVRTRLARARERLRTLLGDYDFTPAALQHEVTQHAC
jgi:RNA polymerase sigma-70 factor (ECF subfamily)